MPSEESHCGLYRIQRYHRPAGLNGSTVLYKETLHGSLGQGNHLRDGCFGEGELLKLFWELFDNAITQHISHVECLVMNEIISSDGCRVVLSQVSYCFLES
jgi:hypothetical protein